MKDEIKIEQHSRFAGALSSVSRTHRTDMEWLRGYALCVAEMVRRWDEPSKGRELLHDVGITQIGHLHGIGIEKFDFDSLKRCFESEQPR